MNRRKKNSRLRGSHTHSYGGKKKHRGAGSRGGRGMAGTGKRGDAKKPCVATNKKYFGVHGFKSINPKVDSTINLNTLQTRLANYVALKVATQKGKAYVIDLSKAGYTKILGSGSITVAVEVTVASASERAVTKIEAAGGKVILLSADEEVSKAVDDKSSDAEGTKPKADAKSATKKAVTKEKK